MNGKESEKDDYLLNSYCSVGGKGGNGSFFIINFFQRLLANGRAVIGRHGPPGVKASLTSNKSK